MKKIPLSQGKFTIVDDDDFERVSQLKWSYINGYAKRQMKRADGRRRLLGLQRFIVGLDGDDPRVVDHINGDTLDNRKENLRICTKRENTRNQRPKDRLGKSTSIYKGVSWKNDMYKWRVRLAIDRKEVIVGYYVCEKEAALAYNKAALEYFGEYAWLNDVD